PDGRHGLRRPVPLPRHLAQPVHHPHPPYRAGQTRGEAAAVPAVGKARRPGAAGHRLQDHAAEQHMSKPLHRVRMSDVAREAGVARVTVSRVISAPDTVAPRTRAAVEAAIARLGFIPNLNAGTLASRRSHIVAALVPTLSNAWFADTMDGLAGTLSAAGYQLMLGQTRYDPEEEEKLVNAFIGR